MRKISVVLSAVAIVALSLGVSMAAASAHVKADVSGTYVGPLAMEGQPGIPTQVELKQDGDKVTGKIGDPAKPEEMFPLTGTVDGDDVTFTAKPAQGDMKVDFKVKVEDGHLKGGGTFQIGDMKVPFTCDMAKK